ncbi:Ig-like domain-containing protein [Vibrio barjaei]|uniref:Ig-like domain-containing protein n=1 Tax=Vibrio barjaei TaxID=1676683 RepID=UPI00228427B9|nr:Ig-like domain-containing protein [Vibrio barjaei]MCY9874832.1 Ig-like domain-containing protein [Vibrio barjaei]
MFHWRLFLVAIMSFFVLTGFKGCHSEGGIGSRELQSIKLEFPTAKSNTSVSIAKGNEIELTALGIFNDGSISDVTKEVSFNVNKVDIVKFEGAVATGTNVSSVNVTATKDGIVSNMVKITVTAEELVSIQVTPPILKLAKGNLVKVTATGYYTDDSTQDISNKVAWKTSSSSVAKITKDPVKNKVLIEAVDKGEAIIQVVLDGITSRNDTAVSVSAATLDKIQITPAITNLPVGLTQQLTALGIYSDATTKDVSYQVMYTTGDAGVATVNASSGEVKAVAQGDVKIKATIGSIDSNFADVKVTPAVLRDVILSVDNNVSTVPKGNEATLIATGIYSDNTTNDITANVTWNISDVSKFSLPDSNGVGKAKAEGIVTITAEQGSTQSSNSLSLQITKAQLVKIQATPSTISIAKGNTGNVRAIGTYTDNSTADITSSVVWLSDDIPSIAVIDMNGLATGVLKGKTKVIAKKDGVPSNDIDFTVSDATIVSIAVSVKGMEPLVIPKGNTLELEAIAHYSDGSSKDITNNTNWSTSNTNVTVVDGVVTGVTKGNSDVKVSQDGEVSPSITVRVTSAILTKIKVSPSIVTLAKGTTTNLRAVGTYSDGLDSDITSKVSWLTENGNVATALGGQVVGVGTGNTSIKAHLSSITSNTVPVEVTSAELQSIVFKSELITMIKGQTEQLVATGVYTDGNQLDITSDVSWDSNDSTVATVDLKGLLTANVKGTSLVKAFKGSVSSKAITINVTDAVLTKLEIEPSATVSIAKGNSTPFTAKGTYSDGNIEDVTNKVIWDSLYESIATVSSSGLVHGNKMGQTSITAMLDGETSNITNVDVLEAVITNIEIESLPATADSVPLSDAGGGSGAVAPIIHEINFIGVTQEKGLYAKAMYSDFSEKDVTSQVVWSTPAAGSSPTPDGVASITGSVLKGISPGLAKVSAKLGQMTADLEITVYGNVAVEGIARQSSDADPVGFPASRVNDQVYWERSMFTHTLEDDSPYSFLEIDLGQVREIRGMALYNRNDCCLDKIDEYYLFISEDPISDLLTPDELKLDPNIFNYKSDTQMMLPTNKDFPGGVKGRYIRVQLIKKNSLSMTEWFVYGW